MDPEQNEPQLEPWATIPPLLLRLATALGEIAPAVPFASLEGSQRFAARAPAGNVALRIVPGGYHEPTRDPGGEALFDEIIAWIGARAASEAAVHPS